MSDEIPTTGEPATDGDVQMVYDAGDLGCGDLVLQLRKRMKQLPAGGVIEVRATDPGAPLDIPAWCILTGHGLVGDDHPMYRIRRRED